MKRLGRLGAWRRLGVQVEILAGIGLAFVGGSVRVVQSTGTPFRTRTPASSICVEPTVA
jgi:hypothetical protein